MMIQAIRYGEQGDLDKAVKYELMAVKELNHDLEDANPSWQTPTNYRYFAGMSFTNQTM
jgi:hypothetical protein